jgi:23S rRNA (adenine2503-C2)-methyltransferase
VEKFKVQFARMGEPSLNPNVLEVLEELPTRYNASGLLPSISTVAPVSAGKFFERLLEIKQRRYNGEQLQLQFSIHTTDEKLRDKIIPVKKWDFEQIARYGELFYQEDERKITLNFALTQEMPLRPEILYQYFDPKIFFIKITPVNPTYQAVKHKISSFIDPLQKDQEYHIVKTLRSLGYEVLVSIGEIEENKIGSNCGQYLLKHITAKEHISEGYSYKMNIFTD